MPAPVNFDPRQLQKKWHHAIDFDVLGNYTKDNAKSYLQALQNHINDPDTQESMGTFRGTIAVYHYYNPKNQWWVCVDMARNYVSGWKLDSDQSHFLETIGNVQ